MSYSITCHDILHVINRMTLKDVAENRNKIEDRHNGGYRAEAINSDGYGLTDKECVCSIRIPRQSLVGVL